MTNIVIEDAAVSAPRPYDANTDVRKFEFGEAVSAAEARATETGIRQRVFTLPVGQADAHIQPRYLVQAV